MSKLIASTFAWTVLPLLDAGDHWDLADVQRHAQNRRVLAELIRRYPDATGMLTSLEDGERSQLEEWIADYSYAGSATKFGVRDNGLAFLLATAIEAFQQLAPDSP